jgi:hypothetical protein
VFAVFTHAFFFCVLCTVLSVPRVTKPFSWKKLLPSGKPQKTDRFGQFKSNQIWAGLAAIGQKTHGNNPTRGFKWHFNFLGGFSPLGYTSLPPFGNQGFSPKLF